MRLADEITLAAAKPSASNDAYIVDDGGIGDACESLATSISDTECFELSSDVVEACHRVATAKPSTILSALPYARLPYPKIWVEWVPVFIDGQYRPTPGREDPTRIGFLLEEVKGFVDHELIFATWAWSHKGRGVNVCPLGAIFDWHADADLTSNLSQLVMPALSGIAGIFGATTMEMAQALTKKPDLQDAIHVLSEVPAWRKLTKNEEEARALLNTWNHSSLTFSKHCLTLAERIIELPPDKKTELINLFGSDLKGEPSFAEAFVIMLNTKNGLNTQKEDLSKLNKARHRAKRSPLREFMITKLSLSQHATRQIGSGTDRQTARQHLVRGHFKNSSHRNLLVVALCAWQSAQSGPTGPL